jgi:hypothetical protein
VKISRDGELLERRAVNPGQQVDVQVQIPHGGPNIVEIEAAPLEGGCASLRGADARLPTLEPRRFSNALTTACAPRRRSG